MTTEKTDAYNAFQQIITILDQSEAILDTAIDLSSESRDRARKKLTPLLMAADGLLRRAIDSANQLEMKFDPEKETSSENNTELE